MIQMATLVARELDMVSACCAYGLDEMDNLKIVLLKSLQPSSQLNFWLPESLQPGE